MRIDYRNRVFGLDMMRFLAIFLVLFAHIDPFLNGRYLFLQEVLSLFGFFGVEMFFVLSGFLIGRILFSSFVEADASLKTILYFWIRRWFRTLPNYYLVLLINILILFVVGYSLQGFEPIRDLWKYFFFAHNLTGEHIIFFPESWSLSVEEYAYIVGPIVIYGLVSLLKQHKKKGFLIGTISILVFFLLSKVMYHINYEDGDKYFWNSTLKPIVVYRIDAIYYGVLGAYLVKVFPVFWKKTKWISMGLSFLLLLAINIYVSVYNHHIHTDPLFWNVFALPLYSIVVLLALPFFSLWKKAPILIKKPVTFISIISYGIYLLHYSVTLYFIKSFSKITGLNLSILVQVMLYMSISISLAYLLYIFYEKPMMDIRDWPRLRSYFEK